MRLCVRLLVAVAATALVVTTAELSRTESTAMMMAMPEKSSTTTSTSTSATTTTAPSLVSYHPFSASSSIDTDTATAHCADFLDHCDRTVATASCIFTRSVTFHCDALISNVTATSVASLTTNSSSLDGSRAAAVGDADDATATDIAALEAHTCRWNLAGDLALAPGVVVRVAGDECLLTLGVGKMLLLQQQAELHATAMSIDASFVRLEADARLVAATHRAGLFPGSDAFGASNGGSGGHSVSSNSDARDDALSQSLGFFDARMQTIDAALSAAEQSELLDAASASWDLAQLWTIAMSARLAPPPPSPTITTLSTRRQRYQEAAQLLLGSASFHNDKAVVAGGGRIRIAASKDVVLMAGASIAANGADAVDSVAGGAGGSVLLQAVALSVAGTIEARGGDAFCNATRLDTHGVAACVPAGGGGRVQIDFVSSQLDDSAIDVAGGVLPLGQARVVAKDALAATQLHALAGAAGTFYCVMERADHSKSTRLVVNNAFDRDTDALDPMRGGAVTSIAVLAHDALGSDSSSDADNYVEPLVQLDAFVVTQGAAVATHHLELPLGDFTVANRSVLLQSLLPTHTSVAIAASSVVIQSDSRVLLPSASLDLSALSVAFDATALLQFSASVHVATRTNLVLDGNVTSVSSLDTTAARATQFLMLESSGDTIVGGVVSVGGVAVASRGAINVTGTLAASRIAAPHATFLPCNKQRTDIKTLFNAETTTIANFTLVLIAQQTIAIGETDRSAVVRAAAVLVCAQNNVAVPAASRISTNGLGERANQGAGAGSCVGAVGGGGGYGGRGADSSALNAVGDYAPGGLAYGTRAGVGMLGSGGGCVDGGAGGGVVMLGARGLVLDGEIHCNGNNGVSGAGGGSGGFLDLLVTDYLRGAGRISAVGGTSACAGAIVTMVSDSVPPALRWSSAATYVNATTSETAQTSKPLLTSHIVPQLCGGGGAGGRLQLTGCMRRGFDECTSGFDGSYTVAGGFSTLQLAGDADGVSISDKDKDTAAKEDDEASSSVVAAAESGTFFGFPCAPGSGGLFCRPCKPGTYKSESNSEECLVCTNAPSNAHYAEFGSITADCDWACDPGYSGDHCVSPLQQLLDACGGEIGFVLVLLGIAIFSILLGYACRTRKDPSYTKRMYHPHGGAKGERQHLLTTSGIAVNNNAQRSRFAWLCQCFYWPRVKYEKLTTEDLPEHMARIYLSGLNARDSPLRLRSTVPPALTPVLDDDEFARLALRINAALAFETRVTASWGELAYRLVAMLCYPFASEVLAYRRHVRVNALKRIVGTYNHACMKGPRAKALQDALKVGYSPDYSLVYLELLNKESATSVCVPLTPIGRPTLPLVLLFAGAGTYDAPFYLDPSDLLVRCVPQCPELTAFIDEPWIMFVAELNALLRVVCCDDVCLVETLVPVAKFLERKMAVPAGGNGLLGGLRIFLGRFYVGDLMDEDTTPTGDRAFKLGILLTNGTAASVAAAQQQQQQQQQQKRRKDPRAGNSNATRWNNHNNPNMRVGYNTNSQDNTSYFDGPSWPLGGTGRGGGQRDASSFSGAPANGTTSAAKATAVSSIREEALRIRPSTAAGDPNTTTTTGAFVRRSNMDNDTTNDRLVAFATGGAQLLPQQQQQRKHQRRLNSRHPTVYDNWRGSIDASLPVPGVLISADELVDKLRDRPRLQRLESFVRLHVLPKNVRRSSWLNHAWMLNTALLSLLMLDLAITFAMVVNLKCVTDGEVDHDCSASVMVPVLLLPPLTLVTAPIVGIVALALNSSTFSRRYSLWNSLSIVNVAIALCACYVQSSRLVAPWFAGPLPLLPVIALAIKAAQSFVIERYVAYQETYKRRRGWRGLMKRRLSDASIPAESP